MAAAVASPAPERVEFRRQPSAPARPRPPAWQRPAGAGPRRSWPKAAEAVELRAAVGGSAADGQQPLRRHPLTTGPQIGGALVASRWKAAGAPEGERAGFQAAHRRGRDGVVCAGGVVARLAGGVQPLLHGADRRVALARVLDAFVASQALPVAEAGGPPPPSPRSIRSGGGVEGGPHWWGRVRRPTRYKEESPRPPRDPSGVEPRTGGAGHAMLRAACATTCPKMRGYSAKARTSRPSASTGRACSLCLFLRLGRLPIHQRLGIWLTAEGEPLPDGAAEEHSKSPYRNRPSEDRNACNP